MRVRGRRENQERKDPQRQRDPVLSMMGVHLALKLFPFLLKIIIKIS